MTDKTRLEEQVPGIISKLQIHFRYRNGRIIIPLKARPRFTSAVSTKPLFQVHFQTFIHLYIGCNLFDTIAKGFQLTLTFLA
jgi:hypothetical protein